MTEKVQVEYTLKSKHNIQWITDYTYALNLLIPSQDREYFISTWNFNTYLQITYVILKILIQFLSLKKVTI